MNAIIFSAEIFLWPYSTKPHFSFDYVKVTCSKKKPRWPNGLIYQAKGRGFKSGIAPLFFRNLCVKLNLKFITELVKEKLWGNLHTCVKQFRNMCEFPQSALGSLGITTLVRGSLREETQWHVYMLDDEDELVLSGPRSFLLRLYLRASF